MKLTLTLLIALLRAPLFATGLEREGDAAGLPVKVNTVELQCVDCHGGEKLEAKGGSMVSGRISGSRLRETSGSGLARRGSRWEVFLPAV